MELNRKLLIGTLALAALAFGGGAYAASQDLTSPRQAFLNDVAKRLKVSPHDLTSALQGAFLDQLQAAVKAGKLTQAQADQLKQRLARGGVPLAPFFGPRAFGGPRGFAGPGLRAGGVLSAAATYLGLSRSELRDQLVSGRSLAQIASAQHKSTSGLKAAILAEIHSHLDKAVSAKMLSSAQEQQILSRLQSRLDAVISNTGLPEHGYRGFVPGPRPGSLPGGPPGAPNGSPAPPVPPAY